MHVCVFPLQGPFFRHALSQYFNQLHLYRLMCDRPHVSCSFRFPVLLVSSLFPTVQAVDDFMWLSSQLPTWSLKTLSVDSENHGSWTSRWALDSQHHHKHTQFMVRSVYMCVLWVLAVVCVNVGYVLMQTTLHYHNTHSVALCPSVNLAARWSKILRIPLWMCLPRHLWTPPATSYVNYLLSQIMWPPNQMNWHTVLLRVNVVWVSNGHSCLLHLRWACLLFVYT